MAQVALLRAEVLRPASAALDDSAALWFRTPRLLLE